MTFPKQELSIQVTNFNCIHVDLNKNENQRKTETIKKLKLKKNILLIHNLVDYIST